jgi:hypothetical protein
LSSNCASRVCGGKSHELVVELAGVAAGQEAVADHGVLIDLDEAAGLADAAALGEMFQDREGFVVGESALEQWGAFAFGEACLAGLAAEEATLLTPLAHGDGEVAVATFAVIGAAGVETAEARQIVHERPSLV